MSVLNDSRALYVCWDVLISVVTAIAGVFAIFANKIDKITEELEDVDKAKSWGSLANIS